MQLPGKKEILYVLEFKAANYNTEPRPSIYISEIAAENLRVLLADDKKKFVDRFDDVGNFIETISKSEIKGIRKLGEEDVKVKNDNQTRYLVCEFGGRHKHNGKEGFEPCTCSRRFSNVSGVTFERLCRERYGIQYSNEITPAMQEEMEKICLNFRGSFPQPETKVEKVDQFESMADIASRVVKQ